MLGVVEKVLAKLARRIVWVRGGRGHACDAAKDGGGFEGRGDVVTLAVDLDHKDGDFEGGVDFGVSHEITPDDAVFDVHLWRFVDGRGFVVLVTPFTVDQGGSRGEAAPLSGVALRGRRWSDDVRVAARDIGRAWASRPVSRVSHHGLALLDVLAQVEGQLAQGDALVTGSNPTGRELLQNLEFDKAF